VGLLPGQGLAPQDDLSVPLTEGAFVLDRLFPEE
jgi:hypothetical protein